MLKRVFKEPLIHFLLMALVIFAAYAALGTRSTEDIVVTAPRIAQFAEMFAKTWQRQPTDTELRGLIDDFVKEEVFVREALALGLEKDDTIIRRRLRLKMEFMVDGAADRLAPTDAELEAYLKSHSREFTAEPMNAFQQVFLDPRQHNGTVEKDGTVMLAELQSASPPDVSAVGDDTLLPYEVPLSGKRSIAQSFGLQFADSLDALPVGSWAGPVVSDYGSHLVKVLERQAGRIRTLAEARDAVSREWSNAKREELEAATWNELAKKYRITIEPSSGAEQSE